MKLETTQEKIRDYLLGRMPEEELAALDELLVTDGQFYEELLIVEDELIDEYLSNELSPDERKSFETYFLLTPQRREQLHFANTFHNYLISKESESESDHSAEEFQTHSADVPKPPPKKAWYSSFLPIKNPALAYSFMAAMVLIVVGLSWLALRNPATPEPGTVYIATLTPGSTRSLSASNKIIIPAGTGTLELRLELLSNNYASYSVELLGEDRSTVWRADKLQLRSESGTQFVVARVPARLFPAGDYQLKLRAVNSAGKLEDLPSYSFRVVR